MKTTEDNSRKNELAAFFFESEKRKYIISLRSKEEFQPKDFMLVLTEKRKLEESEDTNKIRIYTESIDEFFQKVGEMKKIWENVNEKSKG